MPTLFWRGLHSCVTGNWVLDPGPNKRVIGTTSRAGHDSIGSHGFSRHTFACREIRENLVAYRGKVKDESFRLLTKK